LVWAAAQSKTPMSPKRMIEEIIHNAAVHSAQEYKSVRTTNVIDGEQMLMAIRRACDDARKFCEQAPVATLGNLFVDANGQPVSPAIEDIEQGKVQPHGVSDYGAWPSIARIDPSISQE